MKHFCPFSAKLRSDAEFFVKLGIFWSERTNRNISLVDQRCEMKYALGKKALMSHNKNLRSGLFWNDKLFFFFLKNRHMLNNLNLSPGGIKKIGSERPLITTMFVKGKIWHQWVFTLASVNI